MDEQVKVAVINDLIASELDGEVVTDVTELEKLSNDAYSTIQAVELPITAVFAETVDDVQKVLAVARHHHVHIVTKGASTSVVSGSRGRQTEIILDLARMNSIIELNPIDQIAIVQPGVINNQLDREARKHNLFYAPDPGSKKISSIGGNISTNAGGMSSVRYGVTRDQVLGLKVVLADGRLIELGGRTLKQAFPYDLTHLFVGSEGTLGVVVEITVKLLPIPLGQPMVGIAFFTNLTEMMRAVSALRISGVYPTMLEALDGRTVSALDRFEGTNYATDNRAMLIFKLDFSSPTIMQKVREILVENKADNIDISDDPTRSAALMKLRDDMLPAIFAGKNHVMEDMALPLSKMAEMMDFVSEVAEQYHLDIYVAGHAGDGNVHPSFVWDKEAQMPSTVATAVGALFNKALELGGTISGEHAVGTQKSSWNNAELGDTVDYLQHQIKALLDPMNILNPGRKID
ncbi:FAD-binding protein [Weissella muntiaci]|uniref:FAD-binding protein n=1 Tax=Weissella muntiaci TaxID=2508881 RepID=A0A6C2C764_9LACO|nr:FAD-linked oxidase C-terminal domain-containing protein [Weissella muntiaci]TYC49657.1 FAD-binding protein [Weissella muntiaci]